MEAPRSNALATMASIARPGWANSPSGSARAPTIRELTMIWNQRPRIGLRTLILGAAVLGLGSNQARGDWGWGWGFGGFNYVPSPTDFLNQQALNNAARAGSPPSNNVYADNPNSYFYHI